MKKTTRINIRLLPLHTLIETYSGNKSFHFLIVSELRHRTKLKRITHEQQVIIRGIH